MKYSEAEKKITEILESKYGDDWGKFYKLVDGLPFALARRTKQSESFKVILMVSKYTEGWLEVKDLVRSEKALADIFMELALTPLEERKEGKRYVVKIGRMGVSENMVYLGANKGTSGLWIGFGGPSDIDNSMIKTVFTQAEINQLKNKGALNIDWDKAVEEYDGEF
jgi:hypothetical protein